MKRFLLLFLSIFAVVGVMSCNGDTTEDLTDVITLAEALGMPTNLTINETSKTLSWDAVENADAYMVYVDGTFEEEVEGTSYDFSDLSGERLVFTVKAVSNAGYQNSNMSTNIAYVANRANVVLALKTSMEEHRMDVNDPDAFAEELANKGMTAGDLDALFTSMESLENINPTSMSGMYDVIDGVMDDMDLEMIEALVSSLIKVELPAMIEDQLEFMREFDGECAYERWDSTEECYYYNDFTQDIAQLEDLLEYIENNADEAVRSVMIVVEYIMTVQDGIESDIIDNIESIANTEEPNAATVTLMLSVKNDLVNLLKDNLPEVEDFVMINTTMMALANVMSQEALDMSFISIPKQSAAAHMSFELFFNFLLEIDQAYMESLVDLMVDDSFENTKAFIKSNIDLLDAYYNNNQTLIDDMNALYTDEERENLYTEYMIFQAYTTLMNLSPMMMNPISDMETMEEDIREIVENYIDYDSMVILGEMMNENMGQLLDDIIASDYAIVDSMVDLMALQSRNSSPYGGYQFVAQDDDGGEGLNFIITETLQPGDYELVVNAFSSDGSYDLTVILGGNYLVQDSINLAYEETFIIHFTVDEVTNFQAYSEGYEVDTIAYLGWKESSNDTEDLNEPEIVFNFMGDLMALMNPMLQDMTDAEYQAFIDVIYSNLMIQLMVQNLVIDEPELQTYIDAIEIIKTSFDATASNQLDLFQNLMSVLSTTEYMDDLETYINIEDETGPYAALILGANVFIDFYEESETDLDVIITEMIDAMDNADVMVMLDITPQMVNDIESMMNDYFDTIYTQAQIIKDYDYQNLSSIQEQNVQTFMMALAGMSE
jgi:hypothetical protein